MAYTKKMIVTLVAFMGLISISTITDAKWRYYSHHGSYGNSHHNSHHGGYYKRHRNNYYSGWRHSYRSRHAAAHCCSTVCYNLRSCKVPQYDCHGHLTYVTRYYKVKICGH